MKIPGLIIGSLVLAATASAAGICDSPDCPACHAASNSTLWSGLALVGGLVVGGFGFKRFKARSGGIIAALALMLAFAGNSFAADKQFGVAIPTNAPKVTLAELLAKPDAYAGKDVVVEGQFAGACGDGDFFFKDKFDLIEADPPKPEVCSSSREEEGNEGSALYGLVKVHRKEGKRAG